jgi:hypothetical protein
VLPLWAEPPSEHHAPGRPDAPSAEAAAAPATEPTGAVSSAVARRSDGNAVGAPRAVGVVRAVPKATVRPRRSAATAARPGVAHQDDTTDDQGMERAAEWVEQLLEEAGRSSGALRSFVRAFPPTPRWGEPWPAGTVEDEPPAFAPTAASYAAAFREVAAGRRRVRIEGRWVDGQKGAVVASVRAMPGAEQAAWSILAISPVRVSAVS